jgi:hypothetical protein
VNLRDFGQRLIPTGERSGLLTHIATTEGVSLCTRMKKLTAFVELESQLVAKGMMSRKRLLSRL